MPETATSPDIRELEQKELPRAEFPAGRGAAFRVFFDPAAHEAVWDHARETVTVEICGVLVGKVERDEDGPFVRVAHAIRCDSATSKFAEVTFTHESWAEINRKMDAEYRDLDIVGWYHTHPDFGIFLSDRDTFIHQNFFSGPGQIALVVDPVRQIEGVFTWHDGRPKPCEHYWIGERVLADTHVESLAVGGPEGRRSPHAAPSSATSVNAGGTNAPPVVPTESPFYQIALILLAFLLGILIHSLWRGRLTDHELRMMQLGVMHDAWINRAIRPGLGENLNGLERQLELIEERVGQLATEHVETLKGKEQQAAAKDWAAVLAALEDSRHKTNALEAAYALTPAQTDELLRARFQQQKAEEAAEDKAAKSKSKDADSADKKEKPSESKSDKSDDEVQ